MSRRLHRAALRLVLASGAILATLVIGEFVLSTIHEHGRYYPYPRHQTSISYPSEALTPGITLEARFTTNSLGCRGPEWHGERRKLLTIGGSTTACGAVDDANEWPHLVMENVNAHFGDEHALWVTNSGMDGATSRNHIMHATYLVPRIEHLDHVLVYCGLNDVGLWIYQDRFDPTFLENPDRWDATVLASFRDTDHLPRSTPWIKRLDLWRTASLAKGELLRHSRVTSLQKRTEGFVVEEDQNFAWLQDVQRMRAEAKKSHVTEARLKTIDVALDSYDRNLTTIVERVRKSGASPIFMAQAIKWTGISEAEQKRLWMGMMDAGKSYIEDSDMEKFVGIFNERMRVVAERNGVPFIDLPKHLGDRNGLYYDGCHLNNEGCRTVARIITDFLVENVLR